MPKKDNWISENSVVRQLTKAPGPDDKTKSGYPHRYENKDQLFKTRSNSSSTSYREYPVMQDNKDYRFDSKPKDNPGPYRAVTNQRKTYKGTVSHDGDAKTKNPNVGFFHRLKDKPCEN